MWGSFGPSDGPYSVGGRTAPRKVENLGMERLPVCLGRKGQSMHTLGLIGAPAPVHAEGSAVRE